MLMIDSRCGVSAPASRSSNSVSVAFNRDTRSRNLDSV